MTDGWDDDADLSTVRLRESVRALLVDEQDRVLLVHFHWPGVEPTGGFWSPPGGGVEPGEDPLATLQRELAEETGVVVHELGPEVWRKTALFPMREHDGQVDHIHLHRVPHTEPRPGMSTEQLRAEHVHAVRWFTRAELAALDADPTLAFAPRALPRLLDDLLTHGVPDEPLDLRGF